MRESRFRLLLVVSALGAFALLIGLEIATETDEVTLADVAVDGIALLLTIICSASAVYLLNSVRSQRDDIDALMRDIDVARRDGATWRAEVDHHVEGLRSAIETQFDDWVLTDAERDVALFVLKGFSHKEIAELRKTSERTVRQQAQRVYRKSNLPGKSALSAYFLDDLLSPARQHSLSMAPMTGQGHGATLPQTRPERVDSNQT